MRLLLVVLVIVIAMGCDKSSNNTTNTDSEQECDPPPKNAPVATVDAEGSFGDNTEQHWTAKDAVAVVLEYDKGSSNDVYRKIYLIMLTQFENACGLVGNGWVVLDSDFFYLKISYSSKSGIPTSSPETQTYSYSTSEVFDTWIFSAAGRGSPMSIGDSCINSYESNANGSGTLTLTSLSEENLAGNFSFVDNDGGSHHGTFTIPICETNDLGCCYEK